MSDEDKGAGPGRGELTPAEREAIRLRSAGIGKRLDDVRGRVRPEQPRDTTRGAAYGQAMKLAAELVVGLAFGGAIGWFLDRQFGTTPILLVIFVLLGFAAGLMNLVRGARRAQAAAEPLQRSARPVADDDEDDK